jgi:hypothetical protein
MIIVPFTPKGFAAINVAVSKMSAEHIGAIRVQSTADTASPPTSHMRKRVSNRTTNHETTPNSKKISKSKKSKSVVDEPVLLVFPDPYELSLEIKRIYSYPKDVGFMFCSNE